MPQSRRFKALVTRIGILRNHFLPAQFSPVGKYSPRQYDQAKAYVLLVHAEVEAYLEDRARDKAKNIASQWASRQRRSRAIRRLVHCRNLQMKQPWHPIDWTPDSVIAAINSYRSSIDNNNGIKERDVCHLLYPIGIEYNHLNVTLLANLNSFGAFRGSFAHGSIKTHQPVDPRSEFNKVKEIVKGLAKIDRKINRLG